MTTPSIYLGFSSLGQIFCFFTRCKTCFLEDWLGIFVSLFVMRLDYYLRRKTKDTVRNSYCIIESSLPTTQLAFFFLSWAWPNVCNFSSEEGLFFSNFCLYLFGNCCCFIQTLKKCATISLIATCDIISGLFFCSETQCPGSQLSKL